MCELITFDVDPHCLVCRKIFTKGPIQWEWSALGVCLLCEVTQARVCRFPKCDHSYCSACMRNIFGYLKRRENRESLSVEPYGCPPCPNHHVNPIRGDQCGCISYLPIIEEWKVTKFDHYSWWKTDNMHSEKRGDVYFDTKMCPACHEEF
jgi:hypothetical protein